MNHRAFKSADATSVENLFVSVFTESESADEGARIGRLVNDLINTTNNNDLFGFVTVDANDETVGAIFFSRLTFEAEVNAFILSPVAVASDQQGKGIGQSLINHGLEQMKRMDVQFVVTYGDPAFYSKVGFGPLSQEVIRPPFKLSQPVGWIGRSSNDKTIEPIQGSCSCVMALRDPTLW